MAKLLIFFNAYGLVKTFENIDHGKVHDEFTDYQILQENDFPSGAFDDVKVIEGKVIKLKYFITEWIHINKMKIAETNLKRFKLLPIIAEVVLVIPHSNAELERLYSIVRKNKNSTKSSLKLDVTVLSFSNEIKKP